METLVDRFRGVLDRRADAPFYRFLVDGEREAEVLCGAALDRRARAIAVRLGERTSVGDRALILCSPGLDQVAAFFGCLYAGVVAVPVYPPDWEDRARWLPRLLGVLEDAKPTLVLTTVSHMAMSVQVAQLAPGTAAVRWLAVDEVDDSAAGDWRRPNLRGEDLAVLQYTSGATGRPKGVMLSHANLLANLAAIDHRFFGGDDPEASGVSWLPPYQGMGLIGLLEPAYRGLTQTFMSPLAFLKQPSRWLRAISDFRATHSGAPNFAYDLCVAEISEEERASLDLSSWKFAFSGTEPVRAETLERFARAFEPYGFRREAFATCYNVAEAALLVTCTTNAAAPAVLRVRADGLAQHRIEPVAPDQDGEVSRTLVSCGQIIPGHRLVVVDPEGRTPLPDGRVGEIWVCGPSIAGEFWADPQLSVTQLAAELADGEGPFLRTGDLGFLDGGELYVTGRIKDLIMIAGKHYYPQDIEHTVAEAHPALHRGAGVAFSVDADGAQRLVVVQAVRGDIAGVDADSILSAIRAAVARDHGLQVHDVVLVKPASIPTTSDGEPQRYACKDAYLAGSLDRWTGPAAPEAAPQATSDTPASDCSSTASASTPVSASLLEERILQEIAKSLGVPPGSLDPKTPLATYGLQSVELIGMIGDLERWLGRSLPATFAWEYPTIEAMAAFLAADGLELPPPPDSAEAELPPPPDSAEAELPAAQADAATTDLIAIIGIGCRFPGGADGPEAFWRLLVEGRDAIGEVPADRWNAQDFFAEDPAEPGKTNTRWGGFVEGVDRFDAAFFGISPREASSMDPQQRLLAEVTWDALEDAGLVPEQLAGSATGVFVGIATNDYAQLQAGRFAQIDAYTGTGNAFSIAANRLSYMLDLRGPSLAIDTACSSSLVAVQQACASIAQGDCTLAIAGGVNVILSPTLAINFSKAGVMAPDGRCKTFDARANGYVRAEGAGVVVLKPLSDALRDGDTVYAVIRGGAVNQDGKTNGLMAPNPQSQEAVLRAAYTRAGVAPEDVSYVELHGTGTLLGDSIEAKALAAVVSARRDRQRPCLVGSVKSNLGHLEAAAGIAGLIKVALMLRHRKIPASLHFRGANPHIPLDELALRVADTAQPWPSENGPALAGVSSFGFGGTNAHMVLQEAPRPTPPVPAQQPATDRAHLLVISAHTEQALRELAVRHAAQLAQPGAEQTLAEHCAAAAVRRTHHTQRLAAVGRSAAEMRDVLTAFTRNEDSPGLAFGARRIGRHPRVAFIVSGQGPRWWPLSTELLDGEPVFREMLERCDASLRRHVDWSLLEQVTLPPQEVRLADPGVAQPATCALQIALAALWRSWGVEPAAVVGHSLGEVAAAHIAGAIDLDEALWVALSRGRVIRSVIGQGKMAVAGVPLEKAQQILDRFDRGQVSVGASNGPTSTIFSGEAAAVEHLAVVLDDEGIFCRLLESVEYASHSPLMEPLQPELRKVLAGLTPQPTAVTLVSTVTGEPIDGRSVDAEYWATNLRQPVLFNRAIDTLLDAGFDTFVELSGHPMLGTTIEEKLDDRKVTGMVVASLRRDEPGRVALLGELGWLYSAGLSVDWTRIYGAAPAKSLPAYPWQRQRYWLAEADAAALNAQAASGRPVAPSASAQPRSAAEDALWQAVERRDLEALSGVLGVADAAQRAALATVLPALASWRQESHDYVLAESWRYRVTWIPTTASAATSLAGTWLLVAPDSLTGDDVAAAVRAALATEGGTVVELAAAADADRETLAAALRQAAVSGGGARGVVSLLALDETPVPGRPGLARGTVQTLALAQALHDAGVIAPLWLLTRGAVATGPADPVSNPMQALVWGLGRVVGLEYPERWGGLVDLGGPLDGDAIKRLTVALGSPGDEDQLALRPAGLLARRLVRASADDPVPDAYQPRGTVLITGGTGSLGTHLARWLARRGAEHLVLTSRRGAAAPGAAELEAELTALGVRVTLAACDAADRQALAGLLEKLESDGTPVRAVFHTAGDVTLDRWLIDTSIEDLTQIVSGKVAGALNLHELLRGPLDAFVLFSSVTGVWGSGRQCAYSSANAFLDALAEYRRGMGLAATSMQWGAWAGPAHDAHHHEFQRRGLRLMEAGPALAALDRALGRNEVTLLVADMDWSLFAPAYSAARPRPLLYDLPDAQRALGSDAEPSALGRRQPGELRQALLEVEPGRRRRELLIDRCKQEVGVVLRLDPASVDVTAPLTSMGFDSILSLELKKRLEAATETPLPTTLAWRYPTIEALAPFLAERMGIELERAEIEVAPPPVAAAPPVADGPSLDIEAMSDDDVEALLLERLQNIEVRTNVAGEGV